jgi:long-chain acyl-CoA synthetase
MAVNQLWDLSHIQPSTEIVLPGETIPQVFWNGVHKRADMVWMRQKHLGIWRSWNWAETGTAVREIAGGLMALDFAPRETAAILANTVIEWVLADLAVLCAGGVSNGIYPTDAPSQVQYLCEDSRTTILFVEDDEQLDKALEVRDRLPLLRKIVVFDMDGLRKLDDPGVISLDALRELGRTYNASVCWNRGVGWKVPRKRKAPRWSPVLFTIQRAQIPSASTSFPDTS